MAHLRKPLGVALGFNTLVLVIEMASGLGTNSLSLIMDAVHNLSDEMALLLLYLAYTLPSGLSRHFLRFANLFNSLGLLAISGYLIWRSIERLISPISVPGVVPIVTGLIAALGNWQVARGLRGPGREDPAIRLAYVHNMGDVLVSLAPVAAGILILISGQQFFDPLLALLIATVVVASTLRSIAGSRRELLYPGNVACGSPPPGGHRRWVGT